MKLVPSRCGSKRWTLGILTCSPACGEVVHLEVGQALGVVFISSAALFGDFGMMALGTTTKVDVA